MGASCGFSWADRLHRSADYVLLRRTGARFQTPHFVLYAAKRSESGPPRLGLTVSRRVGKAVRRNRLKRLLRECFRLRLRPAMADGMALVVIARSNASVCDSGEVAAELITALTGLNDKLGYRRIERT
ncbi:MAG: ribonuclease P protein component [Candidatus Binataceae bacterium]